MVGQSYRSYLTGLQTTACASCAANLLGRVTVLCILLGKRPMIIEQQPGQMQQDHIHIQGRHMGRTRPMLSIATSHANTRTDRHEHRHPHKIFHLVPRSKSLLWERASPAVASSLAAARGQQPMHSTLCPAATMMRRMQTVPAMLPGVSKEPSLCLLPAWLDTCRSCNMTTGG